MESRDINLKRIAVKVGSNVITQPDGSLNSWRISRIVEDVAVLFRQGREVILITSGAVAAGRGEVNPSRKTSLVTSRQVLSAVGQVKLMASYQFLFGKFGIPAGQVLTTKESFGDRLHYLNMKNCISAMLDNKVIPIVNENDTIAIDELMFTDNDELSGLISSMMDCDALIILTNVDGIYEGSPGEENAELIREISEDSENIDQFISSSVSGSGRGGMLTKYTNARKVAMEGADVYIANGSRDSIILDIVRGKDIPFTRFIGAKNKRTGVKKWITHSDSFVKGAVRINDGAKNALLGYKASSLLFIGTTGIDGVFRKGDLVRILDSEGNIIGIGKSQFDSEEAELHLGEKYGKPLIHYDYMVINDKDTGSSSIKTQA